MLQIHPNVCNVIYALSCNITHITLHTLHTEYVNVYDVFDTFSELVLWMV